MLRTALWTLRQRRYAALAACMLVVALLCAAAGTWQIARFQQSVRDNNALAANAHAPALPLTPALVPLVHEGPAPGRDAIRFRTVTASGTYLLGTQQFLRNESLNGVNGYYVVAALRTGSAVLLVVRGFVAADASGAPPAAVTAAPAGLEHITGRLQTPATKDDAASALGNRQLESINPGEQAARLHAPVYQAYLTLNAGQPGTSGVSVLPDPDLSNPAGGAYEWQHFAYIIQWYLFALLALAAPFAIGRSEVREAQRRFLGIDPGNAELGLEPGREPDERRQLASGAPSTGAVTGPGAVAIRRHGPVARPGEPTPHQVQRAARLADRYGRSLGLGYAAPVDEEPPPGGPRDPARRVPTADHGEQIPNSATTVHRSDDAYQGSYNDYLWQIALADGSTPAVALPRSPEPSGPGKPAPQSGEPAAG